ncbi:DUF3576 domain-containing protein [Frigidibacter sp. MR17.14]|uniref:DUF3576 domain-containing protein n=1 Tax=Frigidibacter sp. MR17.14 TaxID=3126509 RepID=UPI003012D443
MPANAFPVARARRPLLALALMLPLAACASRNANLDQREGLNRVNESSERFDYNSPEFKRGSIFEIFGANQDPNITVEVNRYLWQASLEVLNFLPVQSVDPFSGVITTGFGTPPGGGRAYRATVYVQDPALDARSLKVALQTQGGGAVSAETTRAVEDAILTRARQLRVRDSRL